MGVVEWQERRLPVFELRWGHLGVEWPGRIDAHRMYFSAGSDNEADGVFGYLIKQ
jgi:hypothetical protein